MKRTFLSTLAVAVVIGLTIPNTANADDKLTGCLNRDGKLKYLAIGDNPKRPCKTNQQVVTIGAWRTAWSQSHHHLIG